MNEILVLDIGTGTVVGLIMRSVEGNLELLARERDTYPSRVIEEGKIVDISGAADVVRGVVDRLHSRADVRSQTAHYAVPGRGLRHQSDTQSIRFDPPRTFQESDSRLLSQKRSRPSDDRVIIDKERVSCKVDGESVRRLRGQFGTEFSVEWVVRSLPIRAIENKRNVLLEADLVPGRVLLEPRAVISGCVPSNQWEFSMAVMDFGAGTIDLALIEQGVVKDVETFLGSGDEVSRALQQQFEVSFDESEAIKRQVDEKRVQYTDFSGDQRTVDSDSVITVVTQQLKKQLQRIRNWLEQHHPKLIFLAGGGSQFPFLPRMIARLFKYDEEQVINRPQLPREFDQLAQPVLPEEYTALGISREIHEGRGARYLRAKVNDQPWARLLTKDETYTVEQLLKEKGWESREPVPDSAMMVCLDGDWETFRADFRRKATVYVQGERVDPDYEIRSGDEIEVDPPEDPKPVNVTAGECVPDVELRVRFRESEWLFLPTLVDSRGRELEHDDTLEDGEEYQRKMTWTREEILNSLTEQSVDLPDRCLWKVNSTYTHDQEFHAGDSVRIVSAMDPKGAGLGQVTQIPDEPIALSTSLDTS